MPDYFDLEQFLPYRLNRAAEAVSAGFAVNYRARHGMTRSEWRALALLGATGGITATEITRHSGMHKTKVSRAVAALETRGWLARTADPEDRRLERLELTPAGLAAFADLIEAAKSYEDGLHARLGADGFAALRAALGAIETALPASTEERDAV